MDDVYIPPSVAAAYMEPHRHYHTLEHIYNGLRVMDTLCSYYDVGQEDRRTLQTAWWYHDAVYYATSKTNEADSAALAKQHGMVPLVGMLIRATIYPNVTPPETMTMLERIMVDTDLFGFSQPKVIYDHHTAQVRKEFAHVQDASFQRGRRDFLFDMWNRQRPLFKTDFAQRHWLIQAQKNIMGDINA